MIVLGRFGYVLFAIVCIKSGTLILKDADLGLIDKITFNAFLNSSF